MTEPTRERQSEGLGSKADDGTTDGERRPYEPPELERLGTWRALTLQQSIGVTGMIFPFLGPGR